MAETRFETPFGAVELERYPPTRDRSLRAWDAADLLALEAIAERMGAEGGGRRIVVVNDAFGGLSVPLAAGGFDVVAMNDLLTEDRAAERNAGANGVSSPEVLDDGDVGGVAGGGVRSGNVASGGGGAVAAVLVKVPKSLALLEAQLPWVRELSDAETVVIGAGMVRHIHTSTLELFERILGPTTTSLARRKARAIHPQVDVAADPGPPPEPMRHTTDDGVVMVDHPGVFSQGRLDIGTRALLEHLPTVASDAAVLDLGCGNGVVGATVAVRSQPAKVIATDISRAAVASAQATWAATLDSGHPTSVDVRLADLAEGVADGSVDEVIVNPPFHDRHAVATDGATRMFDEARRVLRPGGRITVVGNRHLGHHVSLGRRFENVEVTGSTSKFVVLAGRLTRPHTYS